MIRGVYAPCLRVHHLRQFVGVRGFQFAQTAMFHQHFRQFVAVRQFLQHFFISGRRAFRGFLQHRQAEFIEQNFLQLFRGRQIEWLPRQFVRLHFKCGQSFGNFVGLQEQRIRINQHATTLHARQYAEQRQFDGLIEFHQTGLRLKFFPQHLLQFHGHVGIFRRVFACFFQWDLVKRQLIFSFAGNVFKADSLVSEITLR